MSTLWTFYCTSCRFCCSYKLVSPTNIFCSTFCHVQLNPNNKVAMPAVCLHHYFNLIISVLDNNFALSKPLCFNKYNSYYIFATGLSADHSLLSETSKRLIIGGWHQRCGALHPSDNIAQVGWDCQVHALMCTLQSDQTHLLTKS